jgi:hypothetical protein
MGNFCYGEAWVEPTGLLGDLSFLVPSLDLQQILGAIGKDKGSDCLRSLNSLPGWLTVNHPYYASHGTIGIVDRYHGGYRFACGDCVREEQVEYRGLVNHMDLRKLAGGVTYFIINAKGGPVIASC